MVMDSNGSGKGCEHRLCNKKKFDKEFDRIFNKNPPNIKKESTIDEFLKEIDKRSKENPENYLVNVHVTGN